MFWRSASRALVKFSDWNWLTWMMDLGLPVFEDRVPRYWIFSLFSGTDWIVLNECSSYDSVPLLCRYVIQRGKGTCIRVGMLHPSWNSSPSRLVRAIGLTCFCRRRPHACHGCWQWRIVRVNWFWKCQLNFVFNLNWYASWKSFQPLLGKLGKLEYQLVLGEILGEKTLFGGTERWDNW